MERDGRYNYIEENGMSDQPDSIRLECERIVKAAIDGYAREYRWNSDGEIERIVSTLEPVIRADRERIAELSAENDSIIKRAIKCGDARRELELQVMRLTEQKEKLLTALRWGVYTMNSDLEAARAVINECGGDL